MGAPVLGDNVYLIQSDSTDRTVIYRNTVVPAPRLDNLRIDATGAGNITLSQMYDSLDSGYERVGIDGIGSHVQSGGSNNVRSNLTMGENPGSEGRYTLSGSGSLTASTENIGIAGTGRFTQSGGTNNVSTLYLGSGPSGAGVYGLSGGNLAVSAHAYVGSDGIGNFNQSGGTATVGSSLWLGGHDSIIGSDTAGTGTYTLSLGTLTVTQNLVLGPIINGIGTFNLSGGTLNVAGNMVNGAGTGTLNLDGGTLNVTGSTIAADTVRVGNAAGSNGGYTLVAGKTLTTSVTHVGYSGAGTVTHSGGTHHITGNYLVYSNSLYLGNNATGSGIYNLLADSLIVDGSVVVGVAGTGTFNHSGGTSTVGGSLSLGSSATGSGTYNLSGGTLNIAGNVVNGAGTGSFNLDGGTLNVAGSSIAVDYFRIAGAAGSDVNFTLVTGKTLSTVDTTVGHSGTGILTQGGGTHLISGNLILAANAGSYGTYRLSGGALNVGGNIVDGAGIRSTFNLDGGTLSVSGSSVTVDSFLVGSVAGSSGSYTLSSGKSLAAVSEEIGYFGTGSITQTGGTHAVSGSLNIGHYAGGQGGYDLGGGNLTAATEIIGNSGTGSFSHSGGTNTAGNYLFLGYNAGGVGTYTLEGSGSLSVSREYVGNHGAGTFNQSGGLHTVTDTMQLGVNVGSSGTYNLTGGTLQAANIVVTPRGEFNFDGGTLAVGHFTGNLANNGGTLAPGLSPGTTMITGDYSQSSLGLFAVEIGGLRAGTDYDVLNVSGSASLGGTLNVSLIDLGAGLFAPKPGDSFDILMAEYLDGSFSSYLLATLDPGLKWDIAYLIDASGSTDVLRLSVNAVPVPPSVWLFGSGLAGLAAVARRKTSVRK